MVAVGEVVGGETRAGKGLKEWPVCAVVIVIGRDINHNYQ